MKLPFTHQIPPFLVYYYNNEEFYRELTEDKQQKFINNIGYNKQIQIDLLQYYGFLEKIKEEEDATLSLYNTYIIDIKKDIYGNKKKNNVVIERDNQYIKNRIKLKIDMYYGLADFILKTTSYIYNCGKHYTDILSEMNSHINLDVYENYTGIYRTINLEKSFNLAYKHIIKIKKYIDLLIEEIYPLNKFKK
jgi:hypothetical protein